MQTEEMTENQLYEAGLKELITQMGTAYMKRFLQLKQNENPLPQQPMPDKDIKERQIEI